MIKDTSTRRNLQPQTWMVVPDVDDDLIRDIAVAIQIEKSKIVEPTAMEEYPDVRSEIEQQENVESPTPNSTINDGYCKIFAQRVYKRLGNPNEVDIISDGVTHTWLEYNGKAFDSEVPCGVEHPSRLPVYNR